MNGIKFLRTLGALAAGSMLLTTGLVGATPASAAKSAPKIVVAPWNGVKVNQTVKVSGSGFKAGDNVFIVLCLTTTTQASGQADCNTLNLAAVTINAKGMFAPTKFKLVLGSNLAGKCGTKATNLKSCDVSVGNMSGGDSATAKIVFAAPKVSKG